MIERYPIPPPVKGDTIQPYQYPIDSCEHEFEVRRMVCANGAVQYRKQCPKCGKGLAAISHSTLSPQERKQAPPFDPELQGNIRHAAWEQHKGLTEDEERVRWFEWYNGYLASPVWGRRRAGVFERSHGMCESCRKARATIIHHLTYTHVGAEPFFELVAVCSSCHRQLHPQEES